MQRLASIGLVDTDLLGAGIAETIDT